MVYDCITFNSEHELFEIRYNILKDVVDEFIVVEFDKTFSGKPKEKSFEFAHWPKVKYFFHTEELYSKYMELAKSSPNTEYGRGAFHWVREWAQKESIKDALIHLKDHDLVFVGDCDEVWSPTTIEGILFPTPTKVNMKVYTYYLNNRSTEVFKGTLIARYWDIKNGCLNHLRSNTTTTRDFGWHFTSLKDSLRKKLTDSYTEDSYASPQVMANLETNIDNNRDFLGRAFTYTVDESQWPEYLKDTRDKYKHLCKQ